MGISGLLPLLKSIHNPCNLRKFKGQTIGIDAYGWLHRGTAACALELALGKPTKKFVEYVMNRVKMLQHFGITPYMVFDGDHLPSKAATELERAKRREEAKTLGLELHRLGKVAQAYTELQKAVDVTPEMTGLIINELKRHNVPYVVAPYEADAQLAYLERKGLISAIISEDSDMLVFGAKCLLTKLDQYGECVEIRRAHFGGCKAVSLVGWTDADFRRMAILSGCDYLASINKMGLKTAYRLVRKYKTIDKIIRAVQFDGQFKVPAGYLESFRQAELTFLHQRVYCPIEEAIVMHTEGDAEMKDLLFIGKHLEPETARGVAVGNLHPMTKELLCLDIERSDATWIQPRSRRPQMLQRTFAQADDVKGMKPIDTIFKPRREPLAELDINSFTPTATQQRLFERHSGASWVASPAPSSATLMATGTSNTPLQPNLRRPAPSTDAHDSPRPPKRRRLCADENDGHQSLGVAKVETGRSRYFEPAPPHQAFGGAQGTGKKKDEMNIFSDEAFEDAVTYYVTPKKAKMRVFKDRGRGRARPTVAPTVHEDSRMAAEAMARNVSAEVRALRANFSYHAA
ncbi:MAG: Rad2 nuclease [Piccolia ochrophora]|nr:MAG: Rad2 nuclease [Piccolia ochrophora]